MKLEWVDLGMNDASPAVMKFTNQVDIELPKATHVSKSTIESWKPPENPHFLSINVNLAASAFSPRV